MKKKENLMILWVLSAFLLLIALTLSTVTFAWFTANRKVQTDKITAKSGSTNVKLEISRSSNPFEAGKDTNGVSEVGLKGHDEKLMPVSTADLTHFWCPGEPEYQLDEKEEYYYHDTVYLRATGKDMPKDTKLDLFLSSEPAKIAYVDDAQNNILAAARLGLKIGDKVWIARFSDEKEGAQITDPDGNMVPAGEVLGFADDKLEKVKDPAVSLSTLRFDPVNPGKSPLITMKLDEIYRVDVYFYLEGCDPDCVSDTAARKTVSLSLPFYGMLQQ